MICRRCNTDKDKFRGNRTVCYDCEKEQSRRRTYELTRGISYEDRDALLLTQDGKCAACGIDNAGSAKGWHVDHSHRTSKIRGVLCATCNVALGQVGDSVVRLQQLINYLRKSNDYLERE